MDYVSIQPRSFGAQTALTTSQKEDQRRWGSMNRLDKRENTGRVVCISYNPSSEQECVVVWANEIENLKCGDAKETVFKVNSPFGYNSARFRSDGALIAYTVGDRGKVGVLDSQGKRLREFSHHNGTVLDAHFTADKVRIATWGSDRQICVTGLATRDIVFRMKDAHENSIFSGDVSWEDENLLCTGCADEIVKIWDTRSQQAAMTIKLGESNNKGGVTSMKFVPKSSTRIVCGTMSGSLRSLDLRLVNQNSQSPTIASTTPHSKTVSDMCFYKDATRVISVGLDGKLSVNELSDLRAIYSNHEGYTGITSVGLTNLGNEISIGFENGVLIRNISSDFSSVSDNISDNLATHWSRPTKIMEKPKARILHQSDLYLRSFSYKKALLASLDEYEKNQESQEGTDQLYALLEELLRRNALRIALQSWNEKELSRLLIYLITHMRHRYRCSLIVTTLEVINEIYSEELIKSNTIGTIFGGLEKDLKFYLENIRKCRTVVANLDCFM